jgi:Xaa-Pro aminopeptidase
MDSSRPGNGSFRENRRRLAMSLPQGALAVIATGRHAAPCGPDSAEPWPDFYYLTGRREPRSALIIRADRDGNGRTILFTPVRNGRDELWHGPAAPDSIEDVRPFEEFESVLRALAYETQALYVHAPENPFAPQDDHALAHLCRRLLPLHPIDRLAPFIGRLRAEKQPTEIENIRAANALAAKAFRRAIGAIRPGVRGFEVKAEFLYEITRHGSRGFCCPAITAAGTETLVLHWRGDRRAWAGDETALLDFTAEWNGLCADAARCIPVGGAFPARHRPLYEAVLRVLNQATAGLRPGRLLGECQREVELLIQHELLRLGVLKSSEVQDPSTPSPGLRPFFMHQAFHHIGLEVHDPVPADLPLSPGQVIAVEPAIYLPGEGFGIRLENNILVTTQGPENLTESLPVELNEIEDLMQL